MSRNRTRNITVEQKLNLAYQGMIAYSDAPQPVTMPRNYKSFSREGYRGEPTVYKCISYIARNGAAIPPKLYTDESKSKEITKHPLLDKLKKPNAEQSGVAYREGVLAYKLLSGNAFQYIVRASKNGPPDELWALRPDTVQTMVAKTRGVTGYKLDGIEQVIDPTLIGHTKYWNPDDETFGLSPLEVAAIMIDQQLAARKWNLSLLQNSARPSGAWSTPAIMAKNDRDKLEEKLTQKFSGARNAGRFPVLDAGLTWQSMGLPPAQMDWLAAIGYNASAIANIFNIAPQLIGDTSSSTYDNMEQAKVASYTEAIFPELDDLYALWNVWLLPLYPDLKNAYLYYDKESVEVIQKLIQAQKDAKADRATKAWMSGMITMNEARDQAGFPDVSGGDIFRFGATLVRSAELDKYAEQSLIKPVAPPDQLQTGFINDGQPDSLPLSSLDPPPPGGKSFLVGQQPDAHHVLKAIDLHTSEQKKAYFDSIEKQREYWEKEITSRFEKYFKLQKNVVVAIINNSSTVSSVKSSIEIYIQSQSDDLKKVLINLYQDIAVDVGDQVGRQLKMNTYSFSVKDDVQDFIDLFGEEQLTYLLSLAGDKITQINGTTLAQIQSELEEGVRVGESIPQLSKRIDDLYLNQIIPNRSIIIARTEVVAASNYGSQEAAKQSGLTLKKVWLSTSDARTRPDHVQADGQEVDLDEPFTVGGSKLMYPGDSSLGARADEVIQCRCTQFYRRIRDEEKIPTREVYKQFAQAVLG